MSSGSDSGGGGPEEMSLKRYSELEGRREGAGACCGGGGGGGGSDVADGSVYEWVVVDSVGAVDRADGRAI